MRPGQEAKLKLAAFQFQKYGMLAGRVAARERRCHRGAFANTRSDTLSRRDRPIGPARLPRLVDLEQPAARRPTARRYALQPGMQVAGRDPPRHAHRDGVPALAGAEGLPRGCARALTGNIPVRWTGPCSSIAPWRASAPSRTRPRKRRKGGVAVLGAALTQANIRGPLHLSTGQEAVAAGVCLNLDKR